MYSPSTNIRCVPYQTKIQVLRSVYLFDESHQSLTSTLVTMTPDCPELKDMPSTLWVTHKYDVGLIKGYQPVVITPRSDYCPHKHRQEAIDGITPMFNSLLEAGVHNTVTLLKHLAATGHKANLSKLQFERESVHFLGHDISGTGKTICPKRVAAIVSLPKPRTKKQMMSFLGMCSYCRPFIPNYSEMERPLSEIIHGKNLTASDSITWSQ